MYLITKKFDHRDKYSLELRNEKSEIVNLKVNKETPYKIGDFVSLKIHKGTEVIDSKVIKPDNFLDFYAQGKLNPEQLRTKIEKYVSKVNSTDLSLILNYLLENEDFFLYPAAKGYHHTFIGGIASHTLDMLEISKAYIKKYNLNQDILIAGIILHDYAKIYELSDYGLNYSLRGNLIGHLVMGVEEVTKAMIELNIEESEETIMLKHLIISHHGKLEYGSPKIPATKEAFVLSIIDNGDAKMEMLLNILDSSTPGEITPPINGFDKTRFYKEKND